MSNSTTEPYSNDFTTYLTQTNSLGVVTGMPSVDDTTSSSTTTTASYTNAFTSYLTLTNSLGVVTGMPSVGTDTSSLADGGPSVMTAFATIESPDVALESDAAPTRTSTDRDITEIKSKSTSTKQQDSGQIPSNAAPSTRPTESRSSSSSITPPSNTRDPTDNYTGTTAPHLSTGAQAGIGAGCGLLGLAALLVLAFLLMKRRKKRRARKPDSQHGNFPDDHKAKVAAPTVQDYVPFAELEAQEIKREMPGSHVYPVELEGSEHFRGMR
jgi:hypothetical protein